MEQLTSVAGEASARPVASWSRPAVVVPVFALVASVGGAFPSFTYRANIVVLVTGGVLFWIGMTGRVPRHRPLRRLPAGTAWWLLPWLLLAVVELVSFSLGSTFDHPTLSKMADPVLAGYLPRAAAYFGWLCAFWGLVRR